MVHNGRLNVLDGDLYICYILVSNGSHDSITHSSGTVIDVGTLVIKQEDTTKQLKELDFVSYAKGMKMVEEMENRNHEEMDDHDDHEDQEQDDEEAEDNTEVIESMSLDEQ